MQHVKPVLPVQVIVRHARQFPANLNVITYGTWKIYSVYSELYSG